MFKKIPLPTWLTWLRLILVPFFIVVYYLPDDYFKLTLVSKNLIATAIFLFAAVTDYLDGYLARKLKLESSFGAFLDPVADKALVAAALVVLVDLHRTYAIAAMIIVIREIAISALREWMAQLGKTQNIAVAYIGKLKTFCQLTAIALLLFDYYTRTMGNFLMIIAVLLTLISMIYYLQQARKHFK